MNMEPRLYYVVRWTAYLILATIVYRVVRFADARIRQLIAFKLAQNRYGCQKPACYPHKSPIGLDIFYEREAAARAGRVVQHYDHRFDQLGRTWEERAMEKIIINTINPSNLQHVLATGIKDFRKIGQKSSFRELLGGGIFLSNGPKWKFSRDLIKPTFAKAEISDLTSFEKHVSRFMAQIPRDGRTIDIQPLMKKLYLDSSTEFIFGASMNSLLYPGAHPVADELLADLGTAITGINQRILAWSRFQHCFDSSFPDAVKRIHNFIDQHVDCALSATTAKNDMESDQSLLHNGRFVVLHEMAQKIRDPVQLRYEILNIFMASRDTISTLTSNTLFQLARHQQVWSELRQTAFALGDHPVLTYELLKSLTPFRHAIHETFRTIGPTGKATRIAIRDTILPTGGGQDGTCPVFVPRGTFVVIPNNSLHHDPEIWGADALEFRPGRWAERKVRPWEFIPFLGGPRICPAQQMVTIQCTYVLVKLAREFETIESRDPVHEYIEEAQLLLTESRNGVLIGLTPGLKQ